MLHMTKKAKYEIPIKSLGDLTRLVNFNVNVLDKRTRELVKRNKRLNVLGLLAIGCAIYAVLETRKQDEQIYRLSVMLKKQECEE